MAKLIALSMRKGNGGSPPSPALPITDFVPERFCEGQKQSP